MISDAPNPEPPRFWSRTSYVALLNQIHAFAAARGGARIHLNSCWRSDIRWGRNRIMKVGDWRDTSVQVAHAGGSIAMNQTDLTSIHAAITGLEDMARQYRLSLPGPESTMIQPPHKIFPPTHVWSEATYNQTQETRLDLVAQLIAQSAAAGLLSAGYCSVEAQGYVVELPDRRVEYVPLTQVQCSMTVRDPAGTGSGWAGASSYDWGRIDVAKLAATALDKCLKSRNPARIEPGRYTLIMEPQATFDFLCPLFRYHIGGLFPPPAYFSLLENHLGPSLPFGDPRTTQVDVSRHGRPETVYSTKLGQRVLDPRVTLSCDPADPDLGDIPFWSTPGGTELYGREPVRWITNGVLTALGYDPGMQVWEMREKLGMLGTVNGVPYLGSFRMEGGPTPIEEMIATTERGLFVTRFWGVEVVDKPSAIWTGTTRDGLWLIEHGKITHPVKNLRWTESPFFALNQLEQIGVAVPAFTPSISFGEWRPPAVTPPIKVRDFSFTALEDAL